VACKGSGIGSKGSACTACAAIGVKRGFPGLHVYEIGYTPEGKMTWAKKGEEAPLVVSAVQAIPEPVAPPPAAPPTPPDPAKVERKKRSAPKATLVTPPAPTEKEPQAQAVFTPAPRPEGLPSFILLLSAAQIRGEGSVVHLDDVLGKIAPMIASAHGKNSFYECDSFRRRDSILANAADIAKDLIPDGSIVVSVSKSSDVQALADALKPFAARVIVGCF
jgi:hypothetical protein